MCPTLTFAINFEPLNFILTSWLHILHACSTYDALTNDSKVWLYDLDLYANFLFRLRANAGIVFHKHILFLTLVRAMILDKA